MLISVVLTIVVLNFHYRGPKRSRVPNWCRRLIIGKIGGWLGFHFINHEQLFVSPSPIKSMTPSCHSDNLNGDVRQNLQDTKPLLRTKPQTPRATTTATTTITITDDDDKDELMRTSAQKHSLAYNIEQILLKMQTQFDPSRIDDEHLKVSILREILECQRLLLTIHARKHDIHTQLLHDIYEEWKILAIIVDRICFIFYLISMLAASIIFLLREPIWKRIG